MIRTYYEQLHQQAQYELLELNVLELKVGVSRAVSALRPCMETSDVEEIVRIGLNPGHDHNVQLIKTMNRNRKARLTKVFKELTRNKTFGINVARKLFPPSKLSKVRSGTLSGKPKQPLSVIKKETGVVLPTITVDRVPTGIPKPRPWLN